MRDPLSKQIRGIKPSGIRKFFDVVNEMPDADARKIIMPVHPKEKRIIVRKAKKNYSPDFTKPKLGRKTGTDGLRGFIKKV